MTGISTLLASPLFATTTAAGSALSLTLLACLPLLGAFLYFLRRFGTAWAMRRWPRTQGRVITAEMRRGKKKSSDGSLLYDPVLRYSYAVGGRTFESTRFTHRAVSNAANLATQFITRQPKDAEVAVYYHPQNPAEAVVQPMPWRGAAVGAGLCAALLLAAAVQFFLA